MPNKKKQIKPEKSSPISHKPALLKEVIDYLQIQEGEKYIDATLGGGGHSVEILKRGGRVLGIDCDPQAIKKTKKRIQDWQTEKEKKEKEIIFHRGNFADLKEIAEKHGLLSVKGILFDLGVSSFQLLSPERGFSFQSDQPLDMRMDPDLKVTAADLINGLYKGELNELFTKLGEEQFARPIARAIIRARSLKPIKTGRELAEIIAKAVPAWKKKRRIHPATQSFQALRIAVNDELNNLKRVLPQAVDLLKPGGRLVIISFHSLEDRIVKLFFKEREDLTILTKKPIRPTDKEKKENPKSGSAKMRVGEKKKN